MTVEHLDLAKDVRSTSYSGAEKAVVMLPSGQIAFIPWNVVGEEIEKHFPALQAMIRGRMTYKTKSTLDSSGAPAADSNGQFPVAEVWNDPVPVNNGLYGWSGTAWVKSNYDPISNISGAILSADRSWLDSSNLKYKQTAHGEKIVNAILAVRGHKLDLSKDYFIEVFSSNHASYKDKIIIRSNDGDGYDTGNITVSNKDKPVWVLVDSLGSDSSFEVLVDYSRLGGAEGVLLNSSDGFIKLSKSALLLAELFDKVNEIPDVETMSFNAQANNTFKPLSKSLILNEDYRRAMASVVSINLNQLSRDEVYRLVLLDKKAPGSNSRIWVLAGDGSQYRYDGELSTGTKYVDLAGTKGIITVGINSNELPDNKLYVNNTSSPLIFNGLENCAPEFNAFIASEKFPAIDRNRTALADNGHLHVAPAIVGARVLTGDKSAKYDFIVFCKDDATFHNNIMVKVAGGASSVAARTGASFNPDFTSINRVVLEPINGSDVSIELFIDYRKIEAQGVLINGKPLGLLMDEENIYARMHKESQQAVAAAESSSDKGVYEKNLRLSFLGSSTTWGSSGGYLGQDSYVGQVEEFLRNQLAVTIAAEALNATGTWQVFTNEPMCYRSQVGKLAGAGSQLEFELNGNELSAALCLERGNAGAGIIELLVDGQLYDEFSTYNNELFGSASISKTGNGSDKVFDLGYSFTFGHVVRVAGVALNGKLHQGGYGGGFSENDDYLVIRKVVSSGGSYQVRHFLSLKNAPAANVQITCEFFYGESIKPTKSTVGNIAQGIGSGVESTYGDGGTAYDPANPVALSSGLDFRQNDPRAIKTWRFDSVKKRKFILRIKALDSRSTGTPALFVSFVTNRMHWLQNAGIGGYKAQDFLQDDDLKNLRQIKAFRPDISVIKLAANDDWVSHSFKAWVVKSEQTKSQVKAVDSAYYLKAISGSDDSYSVEDSRCPIAAITPFSVTLSASTVVENLEVGDQLILGDFKGDNRRLIVRIVSRWEGKTAHFDQELLAEDLVHIGALPSLVGMTCQVKSIKPWSDNIKQIVAQLKSALPQGRLAIGTDGLPNYYERRLEGYPEEARRICAESGADFIDSYGRIREWTYSQNADQSLYLNSSQSVLSTGSSSYDLFKADGNPAVIRLPRNLKVFVDGVERTNDGCHVDGGLVRGWSEAEANLTMANSQWITKPQRLVFTSDVPPANAVIKVKYSGKTWSSDDCHPNDYGNRLFTQALVPHIKP